MKIKKALRMGFHLDGSTFVMFDLLRFIVSFNILDVIKDDNKLLLLLLSACGCVIITCGGAIEIPL
jgi:hypothetical protein